MEKRKVSDFEHWMKSRSGGKRKKKEWMWSPRQHPKQCQVCFGLVAWRLSLVELAVCPPIHSFFSPSRYSILTLLLSGRSIPMKFISRLSVCAAIMAASSSEHLKRTCWGDWKGSVSSAPAQWRFECSLCLAICSRYQTTLSSCQNLPLSLLQPAKESI